MYIDGLNEEFRPPDGGEAPSGPVEYSSEPSYEEPANVLDPETEARVKANHERFMRAAPVPGGQLSTDALKAQGFTVRKVSQ